MIITASATQREKSAPQHSIDVVEPSKFIQGSLELTAQSLIAELEAKYKPSATVVGRSNVVHYNGTDIHAARIISTDYPDYDPNKTTHVVILSKTESSNDFDQLVVVDLSLGGGLTIMRKSSTGNVTYFSYKGLDNKASAIKMDVIQDKLGQKPLLMQTEYSGEVGGSILSEWKNMVLGVNDIRVVLAGQKQLRSLPLSWTKSFDGGLAVKKYLAEAEIARLLPRGPGLKPEDDYAVILYHTAPGTYTFDERGSDVFFSGGKVITHQPVYKWGEQIGLELAGVKLPVIGLPHTHLLRLGLLTGAPKRRLFGLRDTLQIDLDSIGKQAADILPALKK